MKRGLLIGGIIILLIAVGAFAMQGNNEVQHTNDVQVSVTIPPIAMIAAEIIGETGTVQTILGPGASPHTFEPTPQDIRTVSESSLIFAVGQELDIWVTDIAQSANNVPVVTVDTNIALLTYEDHDHDHEEDTHHDKEMHGEGEHHDHDEELDFDHDEESHKEHNETDLHDEATREEHHDEEENHHDDEHDVHDEEVHHDHEHGEYDPHYWLSPDNARIIAATVRDTLVETYPEHASTYEDNYTAFMNALDTADSKWMTQLELVADSDIITFHDAWAYFAEYADIIIVATVEPSPGQQPTPQYLAALEDTVYETNVAAVFTEPQLASSAVEAFIIDTGARYGILDPLGGTDGRDTYIDLMTYNIDTLVSTLTE